MRMRWLGSWAVALSMGAAAPPSADAASIVARDVAWLTEHAAQVVRGTVIDQAVSLDDEGLPWTRTTLSVSEAYKGRAGATVEVWQRGGAMPDGSVVVVHGDLDLAVGEDVVLFLTPDPEHGGRLVSVLLGWSAFEIEGDGPLAPIRRSASDLSPWVEGPDGLLHPPGSRTGPKPPLTLTQLVDRIRAAMEGSR